MVENIKKRVFLIGIGLFFFSGILLDGFKNKNEILIFLLFSFLFFYLKDIKLSFDVFFVFILYIFVSLFTSDFLYDSFFGFITYLSGFLWYSFFLSMEWNKKKEFLIDFKKFIIGFSTFLSIFIIIFRLNSKVLYFLGNNQNYQAVFVGMSCFILYTLFFQKISLFRMIIFVLNIAALVFINSRTSYVSLFFTILFFHFKNNQKIFFYVIISSLVIFLILPQNFIFYLLKLNDPKAYYRIEIWLSSIKAFLNSPLLGWGIGSFEYVFERFKFLYFDGLCFYNHSTFHAHNEFLNIMVECGAVGIIFYLSVLKKWFCSRNNDFIYFIILYITIFSFFDIILKLPFIKIFYFALIGVSINGEKDFILRFRKILPALVLLVFVFIFKIKNNEFIKYDSSYLELNFPNQYKRAAVSNYLLSYYPLNPIYSFELGRFYYVNKDKEKARKYLLKAISLEPNFNNAYLMLSEVYNDCKYLEKINIKNTGRITNFYSEYIASINFMVYNHLMKRCKK